MAESRLLKEACRRVRARMSREAFENLFLSEVIIEVRAELDLLEDSLRAARLQSHRSRANVLVFPDED